jgi:hypothetical protein
VDDKLQPKFRSFLEKICMRFRSTNIRVALMLALLFPIMSHADQDGKPPVQELDKDNSVINTSVRGCEGDISRHCSSLGQNATKVFMCLMAYEDQLSPVCRNGVLEAAMSIKVGSEAIDYSLSACETDVDAYCRNVQPGEGHVVGCIKANESRVSKACITALKETGLWEHAK